MDIEITDEYIARFSDDRTRSQTLSEHTQNVAKLANIFARKISLDKIAEATGKYHDRGKATTNFQAYLLDENSKRGDVPHSIIGAKSAYNTLALYLPIAEIIANIVSSHHGTLNDFIAPDGRTPLSDSLSSAISLPGSNLDGEMLLSEFQAVLSSSVDKPFDTSMLIKYIYSCLVDADRLDAYLFETQQLYEETDKTDWSALLGKLEKHISKFDKNTDISILREKISEQCKESGLRERGIYKLEVSTGGGKTLSSLRFALVHAETHSIDRIIYVVPYLSILSQTAKSIREAIDADDDILLEHHSNILPDDPKYYKLHTGRWDRPIILTTLVQFLESIFSARGSDLRKLHNMANSIMIFDEVQSIPVKCVHLFNSALNFLNKVCNSTVVLCTATQPLLNEVQRKILLSEDNPSIAECIEMPKRTKIENAVTQAGYSYPDLATFVMAKHNCSTLVIVNTKAAAKALFIELKNAGMPVLHLSTNMCSAHRNAVIAELRKRLDPEVKEPVICVSTQLIEAGIDISFECVVRDIAGLDSIFQAAGRCNRHGEFEEVKDVFIINIARENLSKLPDIKIGAEITQRLLADGNIDIDEYYRLYFYDRRRIMDYQLDRGTIYDFLSMNNCGRNAYQNMGNRQKICLTQAIRSAADAFYVIEPGQTEVIVPYGDSKDLLHKYAIQDNIIEKKRLLNELGQYSVSLYKYQIDILEKRGALSVENGIHILANGFYNAEHGIDIAGNHEFLCV